MFTTGRIIFAVCFIVVFLIVIGAAYWKDRSVIKTYYKDIYKLFLIIGGVLAFYYLLVKVL
ncbi:hypothetical protein KFE98_00565 [bacterium SCSIO 12741]|nr:hypothetical protein KFE98_00565 [bacterium SCSIO 12741]